MAAATAMSAQSPFVCPAATRRGGGSVGETKDCSFLEKESCGPCSRCHHCPLSSVAHRYKHWHVPEQTDRGCKRSSRGPQGGPHTRARGPHIGAHKDAFGSRRLASRRRHDTGREVSPQIALLLLHRFVPPHSLAVPSAESRCICQTERIEESNKVCCCVS